MLVSFPAKGSCTVGLFARGTDGRLGIKGRLDTIGLPLDHTNSQWFVNVSIVVGIGARFIQSNTDKGRRPRRRSMRISDTTHVSRLEILFALFTDGQPRVRELDIKGMLKSRRRKREYVSVRSRLWKHHLLQ